MTIKWGTDNHYGVAIDAPNWEEAIAKAKDQHVDAQDWQADAPRAGKCKLEGEECEFRRFKASWCGDPAAPFRIRVVKKGAGVYIAQVCLVGRVGRALVHCSAFSALRVSPSRCPGRWVVSGQRRR